MAGHGPDRDRHELIITGQLLIAIAMIFLGGMLFAYGHDTSVLWLFAAVIIITLSRSMYRGSFDGIIKDSVNDEDVISTFARAKSVHLMATASGMAGIGIIIDQLSTGHAFVMTAVSSIALLFLAAVLGDGMVKTNSKGLKGF